jgi:hypothetical protein
VHWWKDFIERARNLKSNKKISKELKIFYENKEVLKMQLRKCLPTTGLHTLLGATEAW